MARDVRRIDSSTGTAWVDDGNGSEEPVQLVVGPRGVLGVRKVEAGEAMGIDQIGYNPPLSPPPRSPAPAKPEKDHFDISGLDQE